MNLILQIDEDRAAFLPHDEVTGTVSWSGQKAPRHVEIQLRWLTRGKGIVDSEVAASVNLENPAGEEAAFQLRIPGQPYSFSGKLVSVAWRLHAMAKPSGDQVEIPIIVSPTGRELILGALES